MSKVLVDRELLERAMYANDGKELIAANRELRAILAYPAEAEGVEVIAYATPNEDGDWQMLFFDEKEAIQYVDDEPPAPLVLQSAHIAALSAVTAERDRLREDLDSQQRVCIAEVEKVSQLRVEVEALRSLLSKSFPIVEAHAGASHMLEGFRPARNKWDDLVDGIRAAMAAKEVEQQPLLPTASDLEAVLDECEAFRDLSDVAHGWYEALECMSRLKKEEVK